MSVVPRLFDNDGKLDAVVSSLAGPAELWHNVSTVLNHWVRFELEGRTSNRDGIGAQIRIGKQSNPMAVNAGYASGSRSGVHFGLGHAAGPITVEILWPSGIRQVLENVHPDEIVRVKEPDSQAPRR